MSSSEPWEALGENRSRALLGHAERVFHCSFAPAAFEGCVGGSGAAGQARGPLLLSASEDMSAIVWNVDAGTPLMRLEGHTSEVLRGAWAPPAVCAAQQPLLATSSADGTVRVWGVGGVQGECRAVLCHGVAAVTKHAASKQAAGGGASASAANADGAADDGAADDGVTAPVTLRDALGGEGELNVAQLAMLSASAAAAGMSVSAFKEALVQEEDTQLAEAPQAAEEARGGAGRKEEEEEEQVYVCQWGRGALGGCLLTGSGDELQLWDVETAVQRKRWRFVGAGEGAGERVAHGGERNSEGTCFVFDAAMTTADDNLLLAALGDGSLRACDVRLGGGDSGGRSWGAEVTSIDAHDRYATSCTLSCDGLTAVSAGGDGCVCVWDVRTWRRRLRLRDAHGGRAVFGAAFWPVAAVGNASASGSSSGGFWARDELVATWSMDEAVRFWDVGRAGDDEVAARAAGRPLGARGAFMHRGFPMLSCAIALREESGTTTATAGSKRKRNDGADGADGGAGTSLLVARAGGRSDDKLGCPIWIDTLHACADGGWEGEGMAPEAAPADADEDLWLTNASALLEE